ncbi:DUF397 domain-containing protein [Saccharopolyspora sp. NPDC002686]
MAETGKCALSDTKDRAGGPLPFSRAQWAGFLAAVRRCG